MSLVGMGFLSGGSPTVEQEGRVFCNRRWTKIHLHSTNFKGIINKFLLSNPFKQLRLRRRNMQICIKQDRMRDNNYLEKTSSYYKYRRYRRSRTPSLRELIYNLEKLFEKHKNMYYSTPSRIEGKKKKHQTIHFLSNSPYLPTTTSLDLLPD